jgi:protein associated with RNAse G/E
VTQAKIHLARVNKSTRHFSDGLVEDDGKRLKTHTLIPEAHSVSWSEEWQREGRIPLGQVISFVNKYLFYDQFFSIMEVHATTGDLLGFYVDLTTPVRKVDGEYYLTDLILDLWIFPDLTYWVLDEDEWQQAIQGGWVSKEIQNTVRKTLKGLKREIRMGKFPQNYILR